MRHGNCATRAGQFDRGVSRVTRPPRTINESLKNTESTTGNLYNFHEKFLSYIRVFTDLEYIVICSIRYIGKIKKSRKIFHIDIFFISFN